MSQANLEKRKNQTLFEEEEETTPWKTKVTIGKKFQIKIWKKINYLEFPDFFGNNEAMGGETKYKSSALAKIHSFVLIIPRDVFENVLKDSSRSFLERKTLFLYDSIPKLRQIVNYDNIKEFLSEKFQFVKLTQGAHLVTEGDQTGKFYIIKQGTCKILKRMHFQDKYNFDPMVRDFEIMENIEGSFIGEESIFNMKVSYTAIVES